MPPKGDSQVAKRTRQQTTANDRPAKRADTRTRRLMRSSRLAALDADNRSNEVIDLDMSAIEAEEQVTAAGKKEPKRRKKIKPTAAPTAVRTAGSGLPGSARSGRTTRDQALVALGAAKAPEPNYLSIAAPQARLPARPLCAVCGYLAPQSCIRCGVRVCSVKCNTAHNETKCLKFGK